MAKILSYRMTYDSGFAPNPFWDVLTLATCTPNHRRSKLEKSDWIIGYESDELKNKRKNSGLCIEKDNLIIYIAQVDEILSLNDYFHDKRFEKKKYVSNKSWIERRGDNVYYQEDGMWKWIRGHEHDDRDKQCEFFPIGGGSSGCKVINQDTDGNRVFICRNFSYFGDMCVEFDKKFLPCIVERQGTKYCYEKDNLYQDFLNYLKSLMRKYGRGQIGNPIMCKIDRTCAGYEDNKKTKKSCGSK